MTCFRANFTFEHVWARGEYWFGKRMRVTCCKVKPQNSWVFCFTSKPITGVLSAHVLLCMCYCVILLRNCIFAVSWDWFIEDLELWVIYIYIRRVVLSRTQTSVFLLNCLCLELELTFCVALSRVCNLCERIMFYENKICAMMILGSVWVSNSETI